MASGLIYLAIIGMWVAYFLPRWVHNKNEFSGKHVERYKSALRVVAGNTPGARVGTGVIYTDVDQVARVAQQLMRRRIIFSIIFISLVATLVGATMQTLAITSILLPVSALIVYIAFVRRQENMSAIQHRRMDQIHRRTEGVSHTNLSEVITPKGSTEHWIPFAEREVSGVTILPKGTAAARAEWKPNEVPLPTYVNAAKAITPKRTIDLTEPGRWSEEQEQLERAALAAAAPSRDEIFDQQLADEAVARLRANRAVNG
ncbi:unannotated protein [freshwater metagenome]|jgi:hypothetical protein|uniref:Unannotated protein n=1 Tax=freshwater metagenome TaxID=449393 RepID=A0A6J5ZKZ3_9ZZZZ|nr:hypothetical protein [Actinomycetota bacterium]